jgi:hypothetical protein
MEIVCRIFKRTSVFSYNRNRNLNRNLFCRDIIGVGSVRDYDYDYDYDYD